MLRKPRVPSLSFIDKDESVSRVESPRNEGNIFQDHEHSMCSL